MTTRVFLSVAVLLAGSAYGQSPKKKNPNPPPTMNCEQIVASSHGSINLEACKQMMGVQQAMQAAASDPSAVRPGDDKMTCDQIAAEMKQQPITAPDQAKVTEAQVATADFKQTADKEQKEATAMVAKESAELSLLSRLAPTNAAGAAYTKKIEAEQKEFNAKVEKEEGPKAERMITATSDLIGDVGKQMSANPRMTRLFQLATQKQCKMRN